MRVEVKLSQLGNVAVFQALYVQLQNVLQAE